MSSKRTLSESPNSKSPQKYKTQKNSNDSPRTPEANIIHVTNVQRASTQLGDPVYLAERKIIEDKLKILEKQGKTDSQRYENLEKELYEIDNKYTLEFWDCEMDIDTEKYLTYLNRNIEVLSDEYTDIEDDKEDLEEELESEKRKLGNKKMYKQKTVRKNVSKMNTTLKNQNKKMKKLKEQIKETKNKMNKLMEKFHIDRGCILIHEPKSTLGGTKKRRYRHKRQTRKR